MVDVVERKYSHQDEKKRAQLNDFTSGLFNSMLGLGQVLAPLYSAPTVAKYGFPLCCDIIAMGSLPLGVMYLMFTRRTNYPK